MNTNEESCFTLRHDDISEFRKRALFQRLALGIALTIPALAAPLLLGITPAHAVCVQNGANVVCATDDDDGFLSTVDINDLTINDSVTVDDSGGDISGFNNGIIDINGDLTGTLLNNGTIRDLNDDADAINIEGTIDRLINNGIIEGGDDGVQANIINTLTNYGTISGYYGVYGITEIKDLTNHGTIKGKVGDGVYTDGSINTLSNHGTIEGGDDGIYVYESITTLTNHGTIKGGDDGVQANIIDTLTNYGTISGSFGVYGITEIKSLTNNGTIVGNEFDGVLSDDVIRTLTNNGIIEGGEDGVQADTIDILTNNHTITGRRDGVYVYDRLTTLTNTNNGTIIGGRDGVYVYESITTLTNHGTIKGTTGNGVHSGGNIASLINHGTIKGADDGVNADAIETLTNNHTITGGDDGIDSKTITTLTNHGTIKGADNGVAGDSITTLTNHGTINGGKNGVDSKTIITLNNNTNGTIKGGDDGVDSDDIGTLTNHGTIEGGDDGVSAKNSIVTLINHGSIVGGTSDGVDADIIDTLSNFGTIRGGEDGVYVGNGGSITTLINYGSIEGGRDGVYVSDSINTLTNNGTIKGKMGDGVYTGGSINTLTNHGTIEGGVDGVYVDDSITTLTNHGTIEGGQDGVIADAIGTLTNSGIIRGNRYAIWEANFFIGTEFDTTLNLNAGSVLIGHIDLGKGTNTLNIGAGLSLNSLFEDTEGDNSTVPILGTTSGHLVAILDQASTAGGTDRQFVAVDTSAFASFDDALAALTSGIGRTVRGRQSALRTIPALGYFPADDLTDTSPEGSNRFWVEGFGTYREDTSDRVGSAFDSRYGGIVTGFDMALNAGTSLGVMAGLAAGTSDNETGTQTNDSMSYFGGVYASTQAMGLAWDASLTVGTTQYDQKRLTANNLLANGLETAVADYSGWFVNPQLTLTREAANPLAGKSLGSWIATDTLETSMTVSYAGLFLDGYTETGTTNPLTLDDRDIHIASARAALALPFELMSDDGALTTLRLISGVEARTQFGDDTISGTLLGQSVSTTLENDNSFGGFVGLSGEYQTTNGFTAYGKAEALLETNDSYQISASTGLRIAF